jgi:hypothetical protein
MVMRFGNGQLNASKRNHYSSFCSTGPKSFQNVSLRFPETSAAHACPILFDSWYSSRREQVIRTGMLGDTLIIDHRIVKIDEGLEATYGSRTP